MLPVHASVASGVFTPAHHGVPEEVKTDLAQLRVWTVLIILADGRPRFRVDLSIEWDQTWEGDVGIRVLFELLVSAEPLDGLLFEHVVGS